MVFSFSQYEASGTASRLGIRNKADATIRSHLMELDNFLKGAMDSWNAYCSRKGMRGGFMVTSGYRCPQLNSNIGGSAKKSAHMSGYAADTVPINGNHQEYFKWALEFAKSGVRFDQIIVEGAKGTHWVHFGYKNGSGSQRMQTMSYNGSNYSMISAGTPTYRNENDNMSYSGGGSDMSTESAESNVAISLSPNLLQDVSSGINDYDWDDPALYNLSTSELDNLSKNQKLSLLHSLIATNVLNNAEKRCLYIMKTLMKKLSIDYVQAAGIVGNIGYETDGYYSPSKNVKGKIGLCQWDKDQQVIFDRMHYKGNTMKDSTLDEQIEFLVFTMPDSMVYKIKRCYNHLNVCNYFWAVYFYKCSWSEIFKGLNKEDENRRRKESSYRRMYADAAKQLYENNPNPNIGDIGDITTIGVDSRPVRMSIDPKLYVSDGEYQIVPDEVIYGGREPIEDDGFEPSEEDIAYYSDLYDRIMKP